MHLQSLELFGFKSFADKTILNFHEGITAIVGPNGCGKSNVLDAVRWVLGEQSAKSLRGDEMADVIFNGSEARKPVGFAEVSLTFTDCADELGIEWHDVRVTRRVYRDGNSEYFLNKTACRLRDIQSLFADTGIARAAYSMMEQGKIDMILSSRPEDRRAVFEEAAGITKYKTQKREALRKLEATEANLLRIGDIIKEVKRQIGSLQRQAGKARRYQALHADLRVLDTHHSRRRLDALETDLARCRGEITRLTESEDATRGRIEADENHLAEQRSGLEEIDAQITSSRSELQRLASEITGHRNRIQFNRQRAEEWNELIERSRKDVAAAETKRAQQGKEIQEANALIEETGRALQAKEADLKKLTDLLSGLRVERSARESKLDALRKAASEIESRIADLVEEVSGLKIRRETTEENRRTLDTAICDVEAAGGQIQEELAAARTATETLRKNLDVCRTNVQAGEEKLRQHQQLVASTERELAAIERAQAKKESRLEILRQLNEKGGGLAQGSQAVLKGLHNRSRIKPALAGALVANLDVDQNFIPAIEAALGRNLQGIVLKDAELAPEIIAGLKDKKLGRAALVVPELGNHTTKENEQHAPEKSLGWAIEKVKAPALLAPLVRQLLHNVAIFEHLDDALTIKKKHREIAAATLEGEFVSLEGVVFGGSREASGDSFLERKARLCVLDRECSDLHKQRDALLQKCTDGSAALEKITRELEDARRNYGAAERERSESENRILFLTREFQEGEQKITQVRSEQTTLVRQIQIADQHIARLDDGLAGERAALAANQSEQQNVQAAQNEAATRENDAMEQLTELRLTVATERQRYEHLVAQCHPMSAREAELAEAIATRQAEVANFEKRLTTQAEESRTAESAIERQSAQRAELETASTALTERRRERSAAVNETESNIRAIRNSLNDLRDSRSRQQVHQAELQLQIDNLAERVARRYQINLREFSTDPAAYEKTLHAQLKKRFSPAEAAADLGSARASRALVGAPTDEHPASERAQDSGDGTPMKDFGEGTEIDTRGRAWSPKEDLARVDVQKLIDELRTQLDNMGPVNLDAVHEYDELEERHKFLEAQNNDLTNSRRELLDVIAQINSTTRKLFGETFAQVRINFREMFAELFGGGRADLSLLDENDPLNCGIEISAKPPGKQLQSVSLLSGGERSMVAVALLFAIYMVRPSPFCILDEVDAAMDEGNINRFIAVLDRFVEQSQFIIITHNKRTIAKADVLYGVTMEERGVSKLVGIRLTAPPQASTETLSSNGGEQKPRQQRLALVTR
ncbi:MAG: chromosome segregation protein SMC [Acidobacteria bacterium]|nr:MAG: chromosome segregation protein SMC [Acidobacteriota bacterium]